MTRKTLSFLLSNLLLGAAALSACSGSTSDGSSRLAIAGGVCAEAGTQAASTDGCNTCLCAGGEWTCSNVDCSADCVDDARRDDGCNVCVCNDGAWSCTEAFCGGGNSTCPEGETMGSPDGCNTCSCSSGEWQCTLIACNQCIEGETRADECGSCYCQGGQWACSGAACAPVCPAPTPQPGADCVAMVVYARDPSSGLCCEYGESCSAPSGWAQFGSMGECEGTTTECSPGEVMDAGDGCNSCSCTQGGVWACTLRPCAAPCVPGESQPAGDGCNSCTCMEGGGWGCTDMACPPVEPVACGGWLGDTCALNEYCAYEEGQMCGAADASAFCAPRPGACDLLDAPVCGCDGMTYVNSCEAAVNGWGVMSPGACPSAAAR